MRAAWIPVVAIGLCIAFALARRDDAPEPVSRTERPRAVADEPSARATVPTSPGDSGSRSEVVLPAETPIAGPTATGAEPPAPIVMLVLDESRRPRADATVTVFVHDGTHERPADATGKVVVPAPLRGHVRIDAAGAATLELHPRDFGERSPTVVILPPAATLVVRVIDDLGRVLPDAQVLAALLAKAPGAPPFADMLRQFTDAAGHATFADAGATSYQIRVHAFGRWLVPPPTTAFAVAGQRTVVDVTVPTRPAEQCLDLVVTNLETAAFPERIHPRFAFQIDGEATLVRIQRPGIATFVGTPGQTVRVRIVPTNPYGTADLFAPAWPWQTGVVGQPRPLQFERPR